MGGAASAGLLDSMSESYLRQYLGDAFDEIKYCALKDVDGNVPRDLLISTVTPGIPKEVFLTYLSYCPTGLMDLRQYIALIRNAKFLNKANNRPAAEVIFHQIRFSSGHTDSMQINYNQFVNEALPKLAEQRGVNVASLFDKLAFVPLGTENEADVINTEKSLLESLFVATAAVAATSGKHIVATPQQETAAITVQKNVRAKVAKKQAKELKEIKKIRESRAIASVPVEARSNAEEPILSPGRAPAPQFASSTSTKKLLIRQHTMAPSDIDKLDTLGAEVILQKVFDNYCTLPDECDSGGLKKLCRENNMLSKKFTTVDVDIAFRKGVAKALALPDGDPLREGVIFDKRVNYDVFRTFIVGILAHMRGVLLDDFLEMLKKNYIEQRRIRCPEDDHGLAPH